jgi:hypothetical protein
MTAQQIEKLLAESIMAATLKLGKLNYLIPEALLILLERPADITDKASTR